MTKAELIRLLEPMPDDAMVAIQDSDMDGDSWWTYCDEPYLDDGVIKLYPGDRLPEPPPEPREMNEFDRLTQKYIAPHISNQPLYAPSTFGKLIGRK